MRVGGVWRVEVVTFVRSIAAEAAIWTVGFAPLDSVIGVVVADVPGVTLDVDEGDTPCPTLVFSGEGFEAEGADSLKEGYEHM